MKSGLGSIAFGGTSSEYQGIGFVAPSTETDGGTKQLIMSSAKTSGTAISLTGSSSAGTGVSFNYQNPKEILSLGGGQIQITGTGAGAYGISLQNQDALSSRVASCFTVEPKESYCVTAAPVSEVARALR